MNKQLIIALFLIFGISEAYGSNHAMHPEKQLDFVKQQIKAKSEPVYAAYEQLLHYADSIQALPQHALVDFAVPGFYDKPEEHRANSLAIQQDAFGAYCSALAYRLSGKKKYGQKAIYFLNAWSSINQKYSEHDGVLVLTYSGSGLMMAAELMHDLPLWKKGDKKQFEKWVKSVYQPAVNEIRVHKNNWADWGRFGSLLASSFLNDPAETAENIRLIKSDLFDKIASDGSMPEETRRGNNGIWYSYFSLAPMTAACWLAYNLTGENLFVWEENNTSIKKAVDYVAYYNQHPAEWTWDAHPNVGTNDTWPNNLLEAMAGIYHDAQYVEYVKDSRPLIYSKHHFAWVFPTLMPVNYQPNLSKACHGGLDPPSHEKPPLTISGLRVKPALTINPQLFEKRWNAYWISVPDEPDNVYGVYHFRKDFEIQEIPQTYYVHVSGDNRYKLLINGNPVSLGPARCDVYNWNFETVDLAPFLRKGKNVLAAVVWNFAQYKPAAQISFNQTGFLLQGNTAAEEAVNTNTSWKCLKDEAYNVWNKPVFGYYVAGPGEDLTAALYPWNWEQPEYDDSAWRNARQQMNAAMKGSRDYPGRLLVPTPIPPMEMKKERFPNQKQEPITIPPHTTQRLLLDNKTLTTGYLSLLFSQGKNAEIRIGYAEALYDNPATQSKGNRNETAGKTFVGYEDRVIADGGENRVFTPLWWRTWRYVQLEITTAEQPLILDDVFGTTSRYPLENQTTFSASGHEYLNDILTIGWRTARLCANETYMDCPYYEQLQYFGDTRIQAMITMYNTSDTRLVKNALEQGRQSIVADGITMSRYPSGIHQFISSFSLFWIATGYDYWMYRGDEAYIKTLLPAHRNILSWYEQFLKPDYSLAYIPNWFFADWTASFDYGEPPREKEGNSAFQDLLYLMTLQFAAEMEQQLGNKDIATHYTQIIEAIKKGFYQKYWDDTRKLFADTYAHSSFSQHVNSLAVLTEIPSPKASQAIMNTLLTDSSLTPATIYFKYYLFQALNKAGLGDQYLDNLDLWKQQMALGLSTWAEKPEPSRSDCHAWGASPNIELYRIVLGIDSDAAGFRKIRIAPSLGNIKEISGSIPHPLGNISVDYKVNKKNELTAKIKIPTLTSGVFFWKGQERELKGGEQIIVLSNK